MSKKILTALAPVAAIVGFMAIPAISQAATELQCGAGVECANGAAVVGQSTNLVYQIQKKDGTKVSTLECPHIEVQGTVTKNQSSGETPPKEHAAGQISKVDFKSQCSTTPSGGGTLETHITVGTPFILQVQQPDATGNFQVHINPDPPSTSVVQLTMQIQLGGFSVVTCDLSAPSLQLKGTKGSNKLTMEGTHQFTIQSGGSSCGEVATLEGDITFTSNGNPVLVDESP